MNVSRKMQLVYVTTIKNVPAKFLKILKTSLNLILINALTVLLLSQATTPQKTSFYEQIKMINMLSM
jgi:hypothetical protein